MATFSKIDGAEPSTVTFSLASVTQDRNGVTAHQEIVTLGGTESTLAVAAVLAAAPASTAWGLTVRVADPSTTVNVSSLAGAVIVRSSAANALVSVYQSTAADLNVTVAGYVAPSTTVAVSSVSGRVATMPFSTVWASSAGFHFDGVGALQVAGGTSSNSSAYLPVRLTNGTAFLSAGSDYADGSTASNLAGPVLTFDNGSNATMRAVSLTLGLPVNVVAGSAAGSTIVTVSTVIGVVRIAGNNAADGIVHVGDSTNAALRVNVVAGSAASTTVNVSSLAGAVITRSSAANMLVSVYQSTAADLNVTVAGYVAPSTTIQVSSLAGAVITRSSATSMLVSVYQSTAADLNVTVAGYSTTVAVSSIAGPVTVRSSAANLLASVYQSTAADLLVTASQNSTAWSVLARQTTSSGGGVEGSTTAPAAGAIGLHVREALQDLLSTRAVITSSNSTALYTLVSSAANVKHKVYAYSITSTETTPSTIVFFSSNAIDRWAVSFGSGSSGITGANLTVSPPAYIFKTDVHNALRCLIEKGASTQCIVSLSIAYFTEP